MERLVAMLSNRDGKIEGIAIAIFFITVLLALYSASAYRCHARWALSGFESQFKLVVGCLVRTENGWLPDDRIREYSHDH
jgi:hypothetical protein